MNERIVETAQGTRLVLRADVDDAALDWLVALVAREERPIVDGSGLPLGGLLCGFSQRDEGLVLEEPDLTSPPLPHEPPRFVPGVTRALALAYEQHRVHASYAEAPPLRNDLIEGMKVSVEPGWDDPDQFFAYRTVDLNWGSHSGWVVLRDRRSKEAPAEVTVREVILRRPMLARFLTWPPGTSLDCSSYSLVRVWVSAGDTQKQLRPTEGSYLDQRLRDVTPIRFDPTEHADLVAYVRRRGSEFAVPDILFEQRFAPREATQDFVRDLVRFIAADKLYDLIFIRRLRGWLRQGHEDAVRKEIAYQGKLSASEAEAFLTHARPWIVEGKIPPRS